LLGDTESTRNRRKTGQKASAQLVYDPKWLDSNDQSKLPDETKHDGGRLGSEPDEKPW